MNARRRKICENGREGRGGGKGRRGKKDKEETREERGREDEEEGLGGERSREVMEEDEDLPEAG